MPPIPSMSLTFSRRAERVMSIAYVRGQYALANVRGNYLSLPTRKTWQ